MTRQEEIDDIYNELSDIESRLLDLIADDDDENGDLLIEVHGDVNNALGILGQATSN